VYEVLTDPDFDAWLEALGDLRAQRRIAGRILRVAGGLIGDVKYFQGLGELRVDYGPGYRIYFVTRRRTVIILLCGGDKSTQKRDIARALELAREY
jgi:putative addiction module killer protein